MLINNLATGLIPTIDSINIDQIRFNCKIEKLSFWKYLPLRN